MLLFLTNSAVNKNIKIQQQQQQQQQKKIADNHVHISFTIL